MLQYENMVRMGLSRVFLLSVLYSRALGLCSQVLCHAHIATIPEATAPTLWSYGKSFRIVPPRYMIARFDNISPTGNPNFCPEIGATKRTNGICSSDFWSKQIRDDDNAIYLEQLVHRKFYAAEQEEIQWFTGNGMINASLRTQEREAGRVVLSVSILRHFLTKY
jgi:hypothetical protein